MSFTLFVYDKYLIRIRMRCVFIRIVYFYFIFVAVVHVTLERLLYANGIKTKRFSVNRSLWSLFDGIMKCVEGKSNKSRSNIFSLDDVCSVFFFSHGTAYNRTNIECIFEQQIDVLHERKQSSQQSAIADNQCFLIPVVDMDNTLIRFRLFYYKQRILSLSRSLFSILCVILFIASHKFMVAIVA